MDKFDILMVAIVILAIIIFSQAFLTYDETVIEGEVIDVDFHTDYMTVWFENGEQYNIAYERGSHNKELDFTVNSEMRIEIEKWNIMFTNTDNIWYIKSIVKIPG